MSEKNSKSENENNASMNLRSSRRGLSDISNRLINQIFPPRIINSENETKDVKKRKFLGIAGQPGENDENLLEVSNVANPLVTSGANKRISLTGNSSVSTTSSKYLIEKDPMESLRIQRKIPLATKNADPSLCLDILDQMYDFYHELEELFTPSNYMDRQDDINAKMRGILIDWLVEVHNKFKLYSSTLWLCVNIIDRYLEKVKIDRSKLQLVGVTSLLIACKFEEIFPIEVKDCIYITDYAYQSEEVVKMESKILIAIDYQLVVPTTYHFMVRYLSCIKASDRVRFLANYYADRNLQEYDMVTFKPIVIAASCVYLAMEQQYETSPLLPRTTVWVGVLEEESGLKINEIKECARLLIAHIGEEVITSSGRRLIAAYKKYNIERFQFVSTFTLPKIDL